MVEKNNTFTHDLKVGELKESELASLLHDSTLEVKSDQYTNGRHAIEIKKFVKGEVKPSGLSSTTSDYYVLAKSNSMILVKTADLKEVINQIYSEIYDQCKPHKESGLMVLKGRLEMMGDGWRSYCMLVEEEELVKRLEAIRRKKAGGLV
jgi:hypothetical protein